MKKNQFYFAAVLYLVCQFAAFFVSAQEIVAYVTITGARSGQIKGTSTVRGNEGKIECTGFSYMAKAQVSTSSGAGAGKSTGAIVIVKHVDSSTPAIMQALATNESLTSVVIEFYKGSADRMTLIQTVKLTNAYISQVFQYVGTTAPDKSSDSTPSEELTFTAQKIELEVSGGNSETGSNQTTTPAGNSAKYRLKVTKP
jgi:type VI secretion system secreted protein Hcp